MLELTGVTCIECRYLCMPNPVEDNYLCLKTLKKVLHELDELIQCIDFEEMPVIWIPMYSVDLDNYI